MKKGDTLFVRMDYKIDGREMTKKDFDDHVDYLSKIASKRRFMGGGFENAVGGMIVFEASDLEEARNIAEKDPIIERDLYRYEIFEWNLVIVSEEN